ncbi:MAG TPA: sigma 54-interacting transcriptional regulator [Spirochaetia bacterium]|nr:sigma 54-interacting transcriptional regulator [Spirochaetia bacterium]
MKRITLVAGSENTLREIERQLAEYLEGEAEVELRGLCDYASLPRRVGDPEAAEGREEIVLVSSELMREELAGAGAIHPSARVVVARRTVNCDHLDLVVALPPGTRALFVNDHPDNCRECVESLRALGIDHVGYLPWFPGSPAPDPSIKVAITPGEPALVPPGIGRVIDIGARILDFSTLAELLGMLGLVERKIGQFSQRYLAKIVSVAGRLARSTEESRRLAEHLSGVIDSLRHGILVYDGRGRVSVCNENLRAMLKLRSGDPAGATLAGLVRNRGLLDFLEGGRGDDSGLFRLADGDVLVRRFEAGDGLHSVATFRDERDAADEGARLAREYRRRGYVAKYSMEDIVGESEAMRRAKLVAGRLAATDLTILVHGESGTGKELFASAIHAASGRRSGPFLAVDLGALSDDLIESELFGYEEGAFTGAKKGGKAGLFELADTGTIFLDEIGHVSPKVQTRLLRVLQEKEILRVGGSEIKRIDVRVIAASNEDLLERARRGEFREDLYFRLKMGLLRIPPLRERGSDIPLLVDSFLRAEGRAGTQVQPELLAAFGDYLWPGNVRELRNLVTYMLAIDEGTSLGLADLPDEGFFESFARPTGEAARTWREDAPRAKAQEGRDSPPNLSAVDRFVLEAVRELEAQDKVPGREAVAELALGRGMELSPAQARNRIERLVRQGLLDSGRGRRGTRLSKAGRACL